MEVFYFDQLDVNAILSPEINQEVEVSLLNEHVVQSAPNLKDGRNVIERLEATRKERYEQVKKQFRQNIHGIKINVNKEITSLCESLYADLIIIQDKLREDEYLDDEGLQQMMSLWNSEVDDWRKGIDEVSEKMTDQCKKALSLYREELINSKMYNIKEGQEVILQTILDINQIILNNVRVYEEVELHLKMCGRTLINKHNIILKPEDEDETETVIPMMLSIEEEEEEEEEESETIEEPISNYWRAHIEKIKVLILKELPQFTEPNSTHRILLQHLDLCIEHTMEAYVNALNYVDEITIEFMTKGYIEDMDFMEYDWNHILYTLEEAVVEVLKIFRNTACTWFSYNERARIAAEAFERMIKNKRAAKDKELQDKELMINVALDEIRQSSNLDQIMKAVREIEESFALIESEVETLVNNEIKLSKEYLEARELAFDIFQTQTNMFGEIVPMPIGVVPTFGSDIDLSTLLENEIKGDVPEDYKYHLTKGFNWKYGFTVSFSLLRQDESQSLYNMCAYWENERKNDAKMYVERVKDRSARRRSRIVEDIIGVRLAELKAHESAYMQHANGIDSSILAMVTLIFGIRKDFHIALKDVESLISTILNNNCLENPTAKSIIVMKQAKTMYEQLQKRFKHIVDLQATAIETETKWMEGRTVAFMKNIKLFSEGGNYSLEEVEVYRKKIQHIFGKLKKCKADLARGLSKVLNDYRTNIIHSEFEMINASLLISSKTQQIKDEIVEIDFKLKKELRVKIGEVKCYLRELEDYIKETENGDLEAWGDLFEEMSACALLLEKPADFYIELEQLIGASDKEAIDLYLEDIDIRKAELMSQVDVSMEYFEECFILDLKMTIANSINQLLEKVKELTFFDNNLKSNKTQKSTRHGTMKSGSKRESLPPIGMAMVKKFLNYNIQCEFIWLELMYDLCSLFVGMKDIFLKIAKNLLMEFWSKWRLTLKYTWCQTKKNLVNEFNLEREGRRKLEKMLKPSFGHPNNEPLSRALLKSVDEHFEEHMKIQKSALLDFKKTRQKEMERLDSYTYDLQSRLWEMVLVVEESECMEVVTESMTEFICSLEENGESLPIPIDDPLTYNVSVMATSPREIIYALELILSHFEEKEEKPRGDWSKMALFEKIISKMTENMKTRVQKQLLLCWSHLNMVHKDLQKWKDKWQEDIENVNDLYTTKSM